MKLFLSSYENNIFAPFWHLALLCPILFKTKKSTEIWKNVYIVHWEYFVSLLYHQVKLARLSASFQPTDSPQSSTQMNGDQRSVEPILGILRRSPLTGWPPSLALKRWEPTAKNGLQGSAEDHDSGEPIPQVQRRSPSSTRRVEHWPTSEKLREETDRAGEGRIWADHNCTAFTLHCIADRTLDRREEDIGGSLHSPQLRHAPSTLHPSSSSGQLRVLSCLEYQGSCDEPTRQSSQFHPSFNSIWHRFSISGDKVNCAKVKYSDYEYIWKMFTP